ncbi:MAG: hypothetical protein M3P24_09095, partial [Gemmatimonadota bacterium]|nr:hypothetical protein [Gemmatimonadota bacterium]
MIRIEEVADAAGTHGAGFHPTLLGLIVLLPLLGFVINGIAALVAGRRSLPVLPPVGDPYWDAHHHAPSEQEGMDHGVDPHPAEHHDHDHDHD